MSATTEPHSFETLAREKKFRHPSKTGPTVPILNELVAPHIESFNALFDDSGLPNGDGDGRGLLALGIYDIANKVVFDRNGNIEEPGSGWGNKLECKSIAH